MPAITVILDRERPLKLTLNSMIKFQEATGKDILKGLDPEKMRLDDIRALLWACLIHDDKELTLDAVGDMVELSSLESICTAVSRALAQAMPAQGKSSPNPQSRPTG